jgi:hypothetical protein
MEVMERDERKRPRAQRSFTAAFKVGPNRSPRRQPASPNKGAWWHDGFMVIRHAEGPPVQPSCNRITRRE